jgi:hypothetical protein
MSRVTCEKILGEWIIRLDGKFITSIWRKSKAYEIAYNIQKALSND